MAYLQPTVRIEGDKKLLAKLERTKSGLINMRKPMTQVSKFLTAYYSRAFVSQGGLFNAPWPRLNRLYEVRKHEDYPGRPPLVRTGKMQQGFEADVADNGTVISNKVKHFKYHQSSAPRKRLPRRVMMAINDEVELRVYQILDEHIKEQLRAA